LVVIGLPLLVRCMNSGKVYEDTVVWSASERTYSQQLVSLYKTMIFVFS
jgi:hypothetical protein